MTPAGSSSALLFSSAAVHVSPSFWLFGCLVVWLFVWLFVLNTRGCPVYVQFYFACRQRSMRPHPAVLRPVHIPLPQDFSSVSQVRACFCSAAIGSVLSDLLPLCSGSGCLLSKPCHSPFPSLPSHPSIPPRPPPCAGARVTAPPAAARLRRPRRLHGHWRLWSPRSRDVCRRAHATRPRCHR